MQPSNYSKEEFKEELEALIKIHFNAKYYFRDVRYLNNPDTSKEIEASKNEFIGRLRYAFWIVSVLELSKLYLKSRNHYYNIPDILENLRDNYSSISWIKPLPISELKNWIAQINKTDKQEIINKLGVQRDQYFAHSDHSPDFDFEDVIIPFKDFEQLVNFTEEILFQIYGNCYRTHLDFEVVGIDEKAGRILEKFAKYEEVRQKELQEQINKESRNLKKGK